MTQTTSPHVRGEVSDGLARLVLDRPRAINALDVAMMQAIGELLTAWREDDDVQRVEISGEGERGFCSGADVRAIRQLVLDEPQRAVDFFEHEYTVNRLIAHYPKPTTAHLHGVSMGGGLGLALHCRTVTAERDLVLAMPETGIGLFPDVGINWQLSHTPGELGTWMAMTGQSIDAASALYAGLVDELTPSPADDLSAEASQLERDRAWIDECFTGDDPVAVVTALEAHDQARARECAELLRSRSPWSVAVALEAVRRSARVDSVDEVLEQDARLARNYVADSDFVEGVRAQLVDKDRNPQWRHACVEDVPRELVLGMFEAR
ncbi:enoyl-CoA hydratase/isomerase family protein [Luteococcus sediminum]|uniref:enoyl-CoA hydratase/isomerase family protein n=1 Tax=Luteococcus sp. TaxID=1969402 RepID=UPI003736A00C